MPLRAAEHTTLLARIGQCAEGALAVPMALPAAVPDLTPGEYGLYTQLCAALGALSAIQAWAREDTGTRKDFEGGGTMLIADIFNDGSATYTIAVPTWEVIQDTTGQWRLLTRAHGVTERSAPFATSGQARQAAVTCAQAWLAREEA